MAENNSRPTGGASITLNMPSAAPNSETNESNTSRIHWIRSSSAMELIGAVSHFRHNVERYRWYIHSISTIRFLCVLNVTYTLVGLTFMLLAQFPPENLGFQQALFLRLGVCILFFSPLALCADLVALHGLRQYRRILLLPWLIIYAVMLALAFTVFLTEIYHRGIRWHLILLGFIAMVMFTRWRHINLQFKLMSMYTERPTEQAITELAAEVQNATAAASDARSTEAAYKDIPPPPKYEDLEQPPKYEEFMSQQQQDGAAANPNQGLEVELTDLKSIVQALDGQERSDCEARIEEIQRKLESNKQ